MQNDQKFMEATATSMITPVDVMEYCFCPRFVYFMHCLNISQNEERRYKVMAGRELHEKRKIENKGYLRKKIGCIEKDEDVYLASVRLRVRGRVDEVLTMADGTMAVLDYKFAEYKERIFKTLKIQTFLYSGLIREIYGRPVTRGFICFTRSANKIVEVPVTEQALTDAWRIVEKVFSIIVQNRYPGKCSSKRQCFDCTYKNICV